MLCPNIFIRRSMTIPTKLSKTRGYQNKSSKMLLNLCPKIFARRSITTLTKLSENRMQAWQIHSYGDLSELQLSNTRVPVISSPNELLVKVDAAALNPIDSLMIQGYGKTVMNFMRQSELEFPLILGRDFCGTVMDKGQNVGDQFKIGDAVYGVISVHKQGAHAETVIVDKDLTCHKPANLSHTESASILYGALTAWSALFITGELLLRNPKSARVLVLGASGGVGTTAVQMLKAEGAKVVATCSSSALPLVHDLGVDSAYDYTDINFAASVANEGFYDIILDCAQVGNDKIPGSWNYNKYITLNSPLMVNTDKFGLIGGFAASATDLLLANFPKYFTGQSVRWGFFTPSATGVQFIDKLIKNGQISPVIHQVFKFKEIPQAFAQLQSGHLRGKIVIDFN